MITIKVWILVLYMGSGSGRAGGPTIIDNISTGEECNRILQTLDIGYTGVFKARCIEVEKVAQ